MAKAEKRIDTYVYTLELTEDEALTLRVVLNNIGGDPRTTRRHLTDAINNALYEAGVNTLVEPFAMRAVGNHSLYFTE